MHINASQLRKSRLNKVFEEARGFCVFVFSSGVGSNHPNEVGDKNKNSDFCLVSGIWEERERESGEAEEEGEGERENLSAEKR